MPTRLVLFAGAPEASSLKWDENALLDTFCDPVARFVGLPVTPQPLSVSAPSWRSLPLERRPLTTGLIHSFDQHQVFEGWQNDSEPTPFFVTSQLGALTEESSGDLAGESFGSSIQSQEKVISQFYEESYAKHENVLSSQLAPASVIENSCTSNEVSFDSTSLISPFSSTGETKNIPVAGNLSNLRDIPNAAYLASIQPQTMTVNLIVGIISLPEARAIRTRRGANVELIEALVGDESKSGFGINFWLPNCQSIAGDMKDILSGLRPQDIILVRNVALSSFKNQVYGQSLRKDMTKVHLLYRDRIHRDDLRGCYNTSDLADTGVPLHPQVEKTKKVKDWVMKFVGVAGHDNTNGGNMGAMNETLPPDTQ
jgi:hypothetical protein